MTTYNDPRSMESRIVSLERQLSDLQRRRDTPPNFRDLNDATLWAVADGQVPTYDAATGRYIPGDGGGGGCTDVYGTYGFVDSESNTLVREVVLDENATLKVTATAYGNHEFGGFGALGAVVGGNWFSSGAFGSAIGVSDGSGGFAWTGTLVYVVSLSAGTYDMGVRWSSADTDSMALSVGIVVGCYTGDNTVFGGA